MTMKPAPVSPRDTARTIGGIAPIHPRSYASFAKNAAASATSSPPVIAAMRVPMTCSTFRRGAFAALRIGGPAGGGGGGGIAPDGGRVGG